MEIQMRYLWVTVESQAVEQLSARSSRVLCVNAHPEVTCNSVAKIKVGYTGSRNSGQNQGVAAACSFLLQQDRQQNKLPQVPKWKGRQVPKGNSTSSLQRAPREQHRGVEGGWWPGPLRRQHFRLSPSWPVGASLWEVGDPEMNSAHDLPSGDPPAEPGNSSLKLLLLM